ncbi:iron ABC transporter permease [candidate division KSB1 bacterium]|nr:iron ABC transporter permease [Candidatus Aminicenantes bacterium]RQW03649.1 MAG: iron ABC transporter permease [candidate division KSB1 bacterium]
MSKKIYVLAAIVLALMFLTPFLGIIPIHWQTIFKSNPSSFVFWQLRVPRTILGFVAGSILALSGLVCQNLFKNDLATPDLLGISSGAAAGAVLALKFNLLVSFIGFGGLILFSYLGALSSVFFVLLISRMVRNSSLYTFLMCGVALNFFYSALIVFFQYLFDFSNTFSLLRWLMGGISVVGYREIAFLGMLLFIFLFFVFLFKQEFLLASAGDHFAQSRGLHVARFRIYSFLGLAFIVGAVVSICGPIGFIALIVPHVARIWGQSNFHETVILSLLLGGGFLVLADFFARILMPPVEVPVGIITSLFGAPFFLILIISKLKKVE